MEARVGGHSPFQTRDLASGLEDLGPGHAPTRGKVGFEDVRRLGASNRDSGHSRLPFPSIGHERPQEVTPVYHNLLGVEDGQDSIYLMRVLHRASVCLGCAWPGA